MIVFNSNNCAKHQELANPNKKKIQVPANIRPRRGDLEIGYMDVGVTFMVISLAERIERCI